MKSTSIRCAIQASLVLLCAVHALGSEPLDLNALTKAALAHDSSIKAARAQLSAAESGLSEAKVQRWPRLSARTQWTRGDNPVYAFGSLLEQGRFGPSNFAIDALNDPGDLSNFKSGLDLGIPLFTGFSLTTAIRQGSLGRDQARQALNGKQQQLLNETATLTLRLLHHQEVLGLIDARIKASSDEVAEARRLKDRGLVLGSDYFAAEAILSGLKAWRIQIQTEATAVASRLTRLCSLPVERVEGTLENPNYPSRSLEDWTAKALAQRPDLAGAADQVAMAQNSQTLANRSLLPTVKAFASLETNTNDFHSNPSNHLFGLAAQLPFGDPGYGARRSGASAQHDAAAYSQTALEEAITSQVTQAFQYYQGALSVYPVTTETTERAAQSLELFRPQYRAGRQSILDVLRAEEGLARAQHLAAQARFQIHQAYLQLLSASGSVDDKAIETLAATLRPSR